MKRWQRITLIVVVLLVIAGFAVKRFLSSAFVRNKVVAQIESLYGGTVKLANLDVGMGSTSVSGIELFEKDSAREPWLTVHGLHTDLSLFGLVRGETKPGSVEIKGATILLRFDRDGKLTTALPDKLGAGAGGDGDLTQSVPEVTIERSEIIVRKEGAADFVLRNIEGKLTKDGRVLVVHATTENPQWGKWLVDGRFGADQVLDITVKSAGMVKVTQETLAGIPFVPAVVWREVRIPQGQTDAVVKLRYSVKDKQLHYDVELSPESTDIAVPLVGLDATINHGKVSIDDGLIKLRGIDGKAFAGTLRTDADLDFRTPATHLRFQRIEANALDVGHFPESWKFPGQLHGKLRGQATIDVTFVPGLVAPGAVATALGLAATPLGDPWTRSAVMAVARPGATRIHTEGEGRGEIMEAKVGTQPTSAPIKMRLKAVPGGFRFGGDDEPAKSKIDTSPKANGAASSSPLPRPASQSLAGGGRGGEVGKLFLNSLLTLLQDKGATVSQEKQGSTLGVSVKMDDVDLSRFEQDMNIKLPFKLTGRLSFQVKVGIPLDDSKDLKKYKVHGSAKLNQFQLADLMLDGVETQVELANGVLKLSKLTGQVPGTGAEPSGSFDGAGSFQIEPLGDVKFTGKITRLPLGRAALVAGLAEPVSGDFSGTLDAVVPGKTLKDVATWKATARMSSDRVTALGWTLEKGSAAVELAKGTLTLSEFRATLEGTPVAASAKIQLEGAYPFQAKLDVQGADLAALQRLSPSFRPPVGLAGNMRTTVGAAGSLQPLKVKVKGQTQVASLKVETFTLKEANFGWDVDEDGMRLRDVHASLYDGEVTGSATVPFKPEVPGALKLALKDLDAAALLKDVPGVPVKIDGRVSGKLQGSLAAAKAGQERPLSVQLELKAPKLRLQNIPAEQLTGSVAFHEGAITYRLEGRTLGGTFDVEGEVPPKKTEEGKVKKSHLRINGARIQQALQALRLDADVGGTVSFELNYIHSPKDGWPSGDGKVRISDLSYRDQRLGDDVSGELVIADGKLRLRDVSTSFGQGTVRGKFAIDLKHPQRSFTSLELDNVQMERVLKPWLGDKVQGGVRARIRAKLGAEWSGTADIEIERGKFDKLEFTQWRLPLTFRYSAAEGRGQIEISETTAQIGRGRMTAKATYFFDHTSRVEGQLKLARADVQTLLRQTVGHADVGAGMLTAQVDFAGRDMRSLDDLSATVVASFEQTQALSMPVLKQVAPFLGIGSNLTFNKGDMRARLDRGIFRIQRLALENPNVHLFVDGSVALRGRVDLDVTAQTGNFCIGTPRLRMLGLQVPAFGPLPLVVAQEAATLLANRVIQLQVTGTVYSPHIRVLPLATLRQEAVRFFLTRNLSPLPAAP